MGIHIFESFHFEKNLSVLFCASYLIFFLTVVSIGKCLDPNIICIMSALLNAAEKGHLLNIGGCPLTVITLVYQIILQDGINLQAGHFLRLTAGLFDWL